MQAPHLTQPGNIRLPFRATGRSGPRALLLVARVGPATRRSSTPSPGPKSPGRACTNWSDLPYRGEHRPPILVDQNPAMPILTVQHKTAYRYARPVEFGEHRLMLRPRDSHDLRLLDTALRIGRRRRCAGCTTCSATRSRSPPSTRLRRSCVFDSTFRAEQFPAAERALVLEPYAQRYPFSYSAEEMPDLSRTVERAIPDPGRKIDTWARWFVEGDRSLDTLDILIAMTRVDPVPIHLRATGRDGHAGPGQDAGDRAAAAAATSRCS